MLYQGDLLKKFKESNLAKVNFFNVTNRGKLSQMFSLAYNFPTTTSNSSKFCWKKYLQTKWIIRPWKLRQKKEVETPWIFRRKKLHLQKYVETRWIFRPSKLHRKTYVETTWIFPPSKLHRKKYMETTWIFPPSNLHWEKYVKTWKFIEIWSLTYRRNIHVESTSIRRGALLGKASKNQITIIGM